MSEKRPPVRTMMAYLDGELPAEQRTRFERALARHPEWRAEFERLSHVVEATRGLRPKRPPEETWDGYWEEIDRRIERRAGWTIAFAGAAVLIFWGFVKVLAFAENDLVRFGILAVAAGVAILFVMVLRGRMLELPKDRYRRIRR